MDDPPLGWFDPQDQHRECAVRHAIGGIGHLADHAYWCLQRHDPDMGLSYRDSAVIVCALVDQLGLDAVLARSFRVETPDEPPPPVKPHHQGVPEP